MCAEYVVNMRGPALGVAEYVVNMRAPALGVAEFPKYFEAYLAGELLYSSTVCVHFYCLSTFT